MVMSSFLPALNREKGRVINCGTWLSQLHKPDDCEMHESTSFISQWLYNVLLLYCKIVNNKMGKSN